MTEEGDSSMTRSPLPETPGASIIFSSVHAAKMNNADIAVRNIFFVFIIVCILPVDTFILYSPI